MSKAHTRQALFTLTVIFVALGVIFSMMKPPTEDAAHMITKEQIRAARGLLGIKQTDLAKAAAISEMSVKNIERGATDPRLSTLMALKEALEKMGVVFMEPGAQIDGGYGVRLSNKESP